MSGTLLDDFVDDESFANQLGISIAEDESHYAVEQLLMHFSNRSVSYDQKMDAFIWFAAEAQKDPPVYALMCERLADLLSAIRENTASYFYEKSRMDSLEIAVKCLTTQSPSLRDSSSASGSSHYHP